MKSHHEVGAVIKVNNHDILKVVDLEESAGDAPVTDP
jgi:hypothetical protein